LVKKLTNIKGLSTKKGNKKIQRMELSKTWASKHPILIKESAHLFTSWYKNGKHPTPSLTSFKFSEQKYLP
jgi:hypothetical protein